MVFLPGASAVDRDASGHRCYSARAAVDLIRIRTLADGGVPLARIDALLHAQPAEFAAAVTGIDAALQRKIDELIEYTAGSPNSPAAKGWSCPPAWSPSTAKGRYVPQCGGTYRPFGRMGLE
ncbi:helix-turn-helix domain-containing protein [Streptomyces decoyicus]|uniref:helix-turn-helix domain-containing protein n=1 Tax=Streptomyces decoyicus TaxID=249567 RepID=UPI003804D7D6